MESFTFTLPRGRVVSGLGRNSLVRFTDRIESVVTLLATLVVILAVPFAAAAGTAHYERLSATETERVASLQQVPAIVVGEPEPMTLQPEQRVFRIPVRWSFGGSPRTASVEWPTRLVPGDQLTIWVRQSGDVAPGPAPKDQTVLAAVVIALTAWGVVAGIVAASTWVVVWRLDVARLAAWDRELEALADGGSRH